MSVKIRLARIGRHFNPTYRVVVADSRVARDGRAIEQIGHYDPSLGFEKAVIDETAAIKWLMNGAIPSDTVKALLSKQGIYAKFLAEKAAAKKKGE